MREHDSIYWLWLYERVGTGSNQVPSLMERYNDPYDIYRLDPDEIMQLGGISTRLKEKLCDKSLDGAIAVAKECKQKKIDIIGYGDERYPFRLRSITDPPVLLFCRGKLPDLNRLLCIGMVGTRSMSEYGKRSAMKLGYELGAAGACVVSGMALGIDGVSACGAIEGGGVTVAVLGCGIDRAYPSQHRELMRRILNSGAVISEYAPGVRPDGWRFPQRNRIVSGMCQGVIIVEASSASGTMITARDAIKQGREVFALPGDITSVGAEAPNMLIKAGAHLITDASDIAKHYGFMYGDTLDEERLLEAKRRYAFDQRVIDAYGVCSKQSAAGDSRAVRTELRAAPVPDSPKAEREDTKPTSTAAAPIKQESDGLDALLARCDDVTRRVYELAPDGEAFSPDAIARKGIDVVKVITALSMLGIFGLVTPVPGGMYVKNT